MEQNQTETKGILDLMPPNSLLYKYRTLIRKLSKILNFLPLSIKHRLLLQVISKEKVSKEKILNLLKQIHPHKTNKELIRLGSDKDGGYLVPNDLNGIKALFSPGVRDNWQFEEDCYKKGIKKIYMADASVNPKLENKDFKFTKKFIGYNKEKNYITMEEWINKSEVKKDNDLILQMDVEGDEIDIIKNMDERTLNRFRIIVVEFHYLHMIWTKEFFNTTKEIFEKLSKNHLIVHAHINNNEKKIKRKGLKISPLIEFTFIKKDRVKDLGLVKKFPHPLDRDNI